MEPKLRVSGREENERKIDAKYELRFHIADGPSAVRSAAGVQKRNAAEVTPAVHRQWA